MMKSETYLKVDARNRVTLTKISKNVSQFYRAYQEDDKIILEPIKEIPEEEAWLFDPKNKEILKNIKKALQEKGEKDWSTIKKQLKL